MKLVRIKDSEVRASSRSPAMARRSPASHDAQRCAMATFCGCCRAVDLSSMVAPRGPVFLVLFVELFVPMPGAKRHKDKKPSAQWQAKSRHAMKCAVPPLNKTPPFWEGWFPEKNIEGPLLSKDALNGFLASVEGLFAFKRGFGRLIASKPALGDLFAFLKQSLESFLDPFSKSHL